uniref:Uncharacterized protein n=1 Tax=Anguilla anguilla TaxID=7936 RepID=A0A0E9R8S5_ANGAN
MTKQMFCTRTSVQIHTPIVLTQIRVHTVPSSAIFCHANVKLLHNFTV